MGGAEERDVCALGRPHIYYFFVNFRGSRITNISAIADVSFVKSRGSLVPTADPRSMNVGGKLRPVLDTQHVSII